jgi:hypothetical protein
MLIYRKMKKILLIAAIITTMIACEKNDNEEGEAISRTVCLVFIDKDSTDLLNPDNPNGYKFSEMGLYKDPELKERRTNNAWQLGSEMTCISHTNFELKLYYYILFRAQIDYKEKKNGETFGCATSYLKLNETTIDTVYTEIVVSEGSQRLSKVVYNGEDITRTGLVIKE